MSLVGLEPKSGSKHVCLLIAQTGQQGPVLYKGDKGVNVAARQHEGGPAEAGGLSVPSLPWSINRPARMPDSLSEQSANLLWLICHKTNQIKSLLYLHIYV